MSWDYEILGACTLYRGDCREILPTLPDVDAVITDPPYGVGLKAKRTKDGMRPQASVLYADGPESIMALVQEVAQWWIRHATRAVVTPGTRLLQAYPPAADIGCIYTPNGAGHGRWGFTCFHPILYYGTNPTNSRGQSPNSLASYYPGGHVTGESAIDHPCVKPLEWMLWMVERGSMHGEVVLDPFMGSGTTGVACVQLGRRFIGIERESYYFDIACKRITEAQRQGELFLRQPQPTQEVLLSCQSNSRSSRAPSARARSLSPSTS